MNKTEGCKKILEDNISDLLYIENQHPSFQILIGEEIIPAINTSLDINDADNEDSRTIGHTEGVQALAITVKYLKQKSDVMPTDL